MKVRNVIRLLAPVVVALAGIAVTACSQGGGELGANPADTAQVALGKIVYDAQCAVCHGAQLEGQPDWRRRLSNGRLPAPPHDESGHTWHHPDQQLFGMIKNGMTPYAPDGYESDMPAFEGLLSDEEIWAVLAYIKSAWPERIRERQAAISER